MHSSTAAISRDASDDGLGMSEAWVHGSGEGAMKVVAIKSGCKDRCVLGYGVGRR